MCSLKKCGYHGCSKPIEEGKEVKSTLLSRSGTWFREEEKEYCSKECASHDQMAHEG